MSGKYSRSWPDFDKISVLCLGRSPIAHNLVVCTWTNGQVDAAACLSVVGSQNIFPVLFALMHKGGARVVSFDYSLALFKIWRLQCVPGSLFAAHATHAESLGMRLDHYMRYTVLSLLLFIITVCC